MSDASLVEATEVEAPEPKVQRVTAPSAASVDASRLLRALFSSLAIAVVIGVLAFWPSRPEPARPRPALKPPISFDALNTAPLPANVPPPAPPLSATPPAPASE